MLLLLKSPQNQYQILLSLRKKVITGEFSDKVINFTNEPSM